ncbi:hypothetical protein F4824DRAFT_468753 [Ustulina deusta]|nr:hypothetical protein F4824DRAFT_468753 [Ustulina deusta]
MPLSPLSPNVKVSQGVTKNGPHDEFVDAINATDAAAYHASITAPGCENLSAQKSPTMPTSTVDCQPRRSSAASPVSPNPLLFRSIFSPLPLSY